MFPTKFLSTRQAAAHISEHYFTVAARTLDAWPDLPGRVVNSKKWLTLSEVDEAAQRRIEAAEARRAARGRATRAVAPPTPARNRNPAPASLQGSRRRSRSRWPRRAAVTLPEVRENFQKRDAGPHTEKDRAMPRPNQAANPPPRRRAKPAPAAEASWKADWQGPGAARRRRPPRPTGRTKRTRQSRRIHSAAGCSAGCRSGDPIQHPRCSALRTLNFLIPECGSCTFRSWAAAAARRGGRCLRTG